MGGHASEGADCLQPGNALDLDQQLRHHKTRHLNECLRDLWWTAKYLLPYGQKRFDVLHHVLDVCHKPHFVDDAVHRCAELAEYVPDV